MRLWLLPSLSDLLVTFSLLSPHSFISGTPLPSCSARGEVTPGLWAPRGETGGASSSRLESAAAAAAVGAVGVVVVVGTERGAGGAEDVGRGGTSVDVRDASVDGTEGEVTVVEEGVTLSDKEEKGVEGVELDSEGVAWAGIDSSHRPFLQQGDSRKSNRQEETLSTTTTATGLQTHAQFRYTTTRGMQTTNSTGRLSARAWRGDVGQVVGLSSRMNGYPAGVRSAPGQNGGIGWNHYHGDNFSTRAEPEKDAFLDAPDYTSSSVFQKPRGGAREPPAPPGHLDPPGGGYLSAPPPLDTSPPTHSSASLIKAIREELLRLSQKQAAVPSYHS
ncbi:UPF0606 protein [Liparis tanakae]|uniref:UPF0606 protein n=1 Tax=Liparis tanakae TaxID=230148 RepID=A0A4Z2FK72_9TELE|nr:UPF0606 protein [Liparis tanakae]